MEPSLLMYHNYNHKKHTGAIKTSREKRSWLNKGTLLRSERRDIESNKDGEGGREED